MTKHTGCPIISRKPIRVSHIIFITFDASDFTGRVFLIYAFTQCFSCIWAWYFNLVDSSDWLLSLKPSQHHHNQNVLSSFMIIKIIINLDNIIMIIWNFSTLSGLLWLNRWANECEMSSPLYPILLNNHHQYHLNHHCKGFNVTIIFMIVIMDRHQFPRSLLQF